MSDLLEAPQPPVGKRAHSNPEGRLQTWCDRLMDRIVEQPAFVSAIEHAAIDMANPARRFTAQARGVKFGIPDHYLAQGLPTRTCWIEFKRGSSVTSRQEGVHTALERCGVPVVVAHSPRELFEGLLRLGFRLHGNALGITREIEARLAASDAAAAAASPKKKRAAAKPRAAKPTQQEVTRCNALRARIPF